METKILLNTEFKDSLEEGNFTVKITQYYGDIVFGDSVEVVIKHDQNYNLCHSDNYEAEDFPEKLYEFLEMVGWSHVKYKTENRIGVVIDWRHVKEVSNCDTIGLLTDGRWFWTWSVDKDIDIEELLEIGEKNRWNGGKIFDNFESLLGYVKKTKGTCLIELIKKHWL